MSLQYALFPITASARTFPTIRSFALSFIPPLLFCTAEKAQLFATNLMSAPRAEPFQAFVSGRIRARLRALEHELRLFDAQIPLFGRIPGTSAADRTALVLQRNVKALLHDALQRYVAIADSYARYPLTIPQMAACHVLALQQLQLPALRERLDGLQRALAATLPRAAPGAGVDQQLGALQLAFPYGFIASLLSDAAFVRRLLRAAAAYRPDEHVAAVARVFELVRAFGGGSTDAACFALAESLVTFFSAPIMMRCRWSPRANLSAFEKSVLIARCGVRLCGLSPGIVAHLRSGACGGAEAAAAEEAEIQYSAVFRPNQYFDEENEVREVEHVVLELRKLQFQTSPSSMLWIFSNAMRLLKNSLSVDGKPVGADEIFQFFVYSLAAAKIPNLPALVNFVDSFVNDSLRETQYQYFITQFQTAYEFISSRQCESSKSMLFPFREIPDCLKKNVRLESEEAMALQGFAVYAFPTWKEECSKLFPAIIKYTGKLSDVAYVYKYSVIELDTSFYSKYNIELISTLNGSFFKIPDDMIFNYSMIRIQSGCFNEDVLNDIQLTSALMLMVPKNLKSSGKYKEEGLFDIVKETWKIQKIEDVFSIIAEIQKSLMVLGINNGTFTIDGILDYETLVALKKYIGKQDILLSPYIFNRILTNAESIFHTNNK